MADSVSPRSGTPSNITQGQLSPSHPKFFDMALLVKAIGLALLSTCETMS